MKNIARKLFNVTVGGLVTAALSQTMMLSTARAANLFTVVFSSFECAEAGQYFLEKDIEAVGCVGLGGDEYAVIFSSAGECFAAAQYLIENDIGALGCAGLGREYTVIFPSADCADAGRYFIEKDIEAVGCAAI